MYARVFFCCVFSGSLIIFTVFFLLIPTLYLLVLLCVLSSVWLCVVLSGEFVLCFYP